MFKPGTQRAAENQVIANIGARVIEYFQHVNVYHVTTAAGKTVPETVARFQQDPNVLGASPNYIDTNAGHLTTPNDPLFPRQWGLDNTGTNLVGAAGIAGNAVGVIDADIDAPQAWEHLTDCSGEVVAVLDSGTDIAHPDFAGNIWTNPGEIPGDGVDNDGSGVIDDVNGANFAAHEMHAENVAANGLFDAGEAIYYDVDSTSTVSAPDVLLSGPAQLAGTALINFIPAPPFPPPMPPPAVNGERHAENIAADGRYNAGESIYQDLDANYMVSAGDVLVQGPAQPAGTALLNFARLPNNNVTDVTGHGTNVASVIGARGNNATDIAGVCWQVQILTVKIARPPAPGSITIADRVAGINYVVGLAGLGINVRIINNSSRGLRPASAPELAAITAAGAAGILFVTAAGNDGINVDGPMGPCHPCNYVPAPTDNVVCVGSSDNRDNLGVLSNSNWGTTSVDLNAPGDDILMLRRAADGGGTEYASGTSFATPHVAGIAAHFWSLPGFGGHTVADLKTRLLTGFNGPLGVPHPHGVDPRPGLIGTVVSGINNDGRARMTMGDDFGDAPDPPYPTRLASWGARHEDIGEEWLGCAPDFCFLPIFSDVSPEFDAFDSPAWPPDPDGIQNLVDTDAHDDGIVLFPPYVFSPPGGPPNIGTVWVYIDTENNAVVDLDMGRYGGGHDPNDGVHGAFDDKYVWVNGFFDWNKDGDWNDFAEHVFTLRADPSTWVPATGGWYIINFNMPPAPPEFGPYDHWSRFRLDYGENLGQSLAAPIFPVGPSAGGLVDFWDVPGLPFLKGFYVPNRYESVFVGGPPDLDLKLGVAQFGEVEDYIFEVKKPSPPVIEGIDLFTTLGGGRTFTGQLTANPLPSGFFDPGSDPFDQVINLTGLPFLPASTWGSTDTIVERLDRAEFPQCGPPGEVPVPIVIRALSLMSEAPITVTYGGGGSPELWDVRVCLSDFPQPIGTMIIRPMCLDGGEWESLLRVLAKFIFIRRSDGAVRILDAGAAGMDPIDFTTTCGGGVCHWSRDSGPDHDVIAVGPGEAVDGNCDGVAEILSVGSSNFIPGLRPVPCEGTPDACKDGSQQKDKELTEEEAKLDKHGILPPQRRDPTCQTCPGDTNSDNKRDGADIQTFVECYLEGLTEIEKCPCADMIRDGVLNTADLVAFVNELLHPTPWPPPCTKPDTSCQRPDGANGYLTNRADALVAENFVPVISGDVVNVCWWGAYFDGFGDCWSGQPDDFEVRYYFDAGGFPGPLYAGPFRQADNSLNVVGPVLTGNLIAGFVPQREFAATHPPVHFPAGLTFWVEVSNGPLGGGCNFYWETSSEGDGRGVQDLLGTIPGYGPEDTVQTDFAVCVTLPLVQEQLGACCISGNCFDQMSPAACADAGGQYQGDGSTCQKTFCPPPFGACCVGPNCFEGTAEDCANNGGDYRGDNTTCEQVICGGGPPPNDNCFNATPINGVGIFPFDNAAATTDGPAHAGCDFFGQPGIDHDVWFCWTSPCGGQVTIDTCGLTSVDTKIAVYVGCMCPVSDGRLRACNDDACGVQTQVVFSAVPGQQFLIRLGTFPGASGGTGQFRINCGGVAGPAGRSSDTAPARALIEPAPIHKAFARPSAESATRAGVSPGAREPKTAIGGPSGR